VCSVQSAKAIVIAAAIATFTITIRPRKFALACMWRSVYLAAEGKGTSVSPGTFIVIGANRPPSAIPPGSGWYSSIAICETGIVVTALTGLSLIVNDATARIGWPLSATSGIGV